MYHRRRRRRRRRRRDRSGAQLRFPRRQLLETVWKIKIVRIVESHERAERDQQALFGHLTLPESTFNEPSSYFPDSLSRQFVNRGNLPTTLLPAKAPLDHTP
jgi:hypothetical protein